MFVIDLLITGIISAAICQDAYNNLATEQAPIDVSPNPQPETPLQPQVDAPVESENQPTESVVQNEGSKPTDTPPSNPVV